MIFDILRQQKKSFNIKVAGSEISGIKHNSIQKNGCRVYRDKKIFSSAQVGEISDEQLLAMANSKSNVGVKYDYKLSQPNFFSHSNKEDAPASQDLIHEFNNLLDKVRLDLPDLVWSGEYEHSIESNSFVSSDGHNLSTSGTCVDWYLLYKKKGSKNMMDGFIAHRGVRGSLIDTYNGYFDFIKKLDQFEKPHANRVPVMFVQIDEHIQWKIGDEISANKFETGSSLLSGKIGENIFSEQVSIYDVNFQPEYSVYNRFDGEGVLRENLPIIQNGVFLNALYDLRSAKKYNKKTTGNGFRQYNSGVSVRHFNLVFNRGNESWRSMVRQMDECIVVFVAAGGACDDNWDYSTPVQVSFLLRKGEIVGQCPQLTIKANLKEMFGSRFIGVSTESFIGDELNPCVFSEMDIILH
jgi:PmbA protein